VVASNRLEMDFHLLGPLEVLRDHMQVQIAAGKQRALLAILLLNANRTVSREQLVDALWGEHVPDSAQKMVQIYVSQLRKALPEPRLKTRAPGYMLEFGEDELDLTRFERLLAEGRQALSNGEAARAAGQLREALALWRGPALAEFSEPFARLESGRLEELRVAALEGRLEADLALGRHGEVVGELDSLIAKHPLRERLRSQHMLALYQSGRQAEALASYQAFRRTLDDELGIEPSSALKKLEQRILRQDPELEPRSAHATVGAVRDVSHEPAAPGFDVGYARSGDVRIAYQIVGDGPLDIVLVHGWVCSFQPGWENPKLAAFYRRLASLGRLILFDKRGTGLSDRVSPERLPDLETRMDDVRAVLDAVDSHRAVVLGISEGGAMSTLFAATHPERTLALVLMGAFARMMHAADYPFGVTQGDYGKRLAALDEDDWAPAATKEWLARAAPDLLRDPAAVQWYVSYILRGASPGASKAIRRMNEQIDIRDVLPTISVPTLVLHRSREYYREGTRFMGEHIPGACVVELPGNDHLPWEGDREALLDEIERFLSGVRDETEQDRVLATLLFTDLVGSTAKAAELGDRAWQDLLTKHHRLVRAQIARFRGREVDMAGDGVFATFDGPARAVRCASAIADGLKALGLDVRAGVHTGEIEQAKGNVRGIAVHVAARIAAAARPGEVLVSSTVRDIVAGSGIPFEERGEHELDGVPGSWRLFAALKGAKTRFGAARVGGLDSRRPIV
jgi:DNA-binding SARP family transcriptional activator/class 3 adenylate cyclase/alpha-beta hydrolase superfamily lysophospholipase